MYFIGICASFIVLLMQIFHKWIEAPIHKIIRVKNVDANGFNEEIRSKCENMGVSIALSFAVKNPNSNTKKLCIYRCNSFKT